MTSLGLLASALTATVAYVPVTSAGHPCCVATDSGGHAFVVSNGTANTSSGISITTVATTQTTIVVGLSAAYANAAGLDAQGSLWVVGSTYVVSQTNPFPVGYNVGLLAKIDPRGHLLFSIPIGGADANGVTIAAALALDPQGNAYVAGQTSQRDFPTRSGAFQDASASGNYSFAAKFSAVGALVYSTVLGGKRPASNSALYADVDSNGVLTIGGLTGDSDFPVTAGVLQTSCGCAAGAAGSFVTRLNAAGTGLIWSTFLGGSAGLPLGSFLQGLAADQAGNIVVAFGNIEATYIAKLDATATRLIFVHRFAGVGSDTQIAMRVDEAGNIWFTDNITSPDQFPLLSGSLALGSALLAELAEDGSSLLRTEALPGGSVGRDRALGSDSIVAVSTTGSILRLSMQPSAAPSIIGVADSAATTVSGTVAPGEFLSIYGTGLSGASATFDGIAAPILFDSAQQINVLMPYAVANRAATTLQLVGLDGTSQTLPLFVVPAQPNVFAVLNQDGTRNSQSNPASTGSTISIFVSGAGVLDQSVPDGSITPDLAPQPVLGVSVTANCGPPPQFASGDNCPRLIQPSYAASAPGQRVNLLQVNVAILDTFVSVPAGGFQLSQGLYSTPAHIYTKVK